jgi:predicted DNA binding CopG/RHH family protein
MNETAEEKVKTMLGVISQWEEVPLFDEEQSEATFWLENQVDLRLMESSVVRGSDQTESVTITLRMDPRMLARIKRIARSRYLNYQSMIKQWLSERIEKEIRDR